MANQLVSNYAVQIEELLQQLSDEEVVSLANTITGGLLKNKVNTRQDAIKAVISYSEDLSSIFRRKIFTRERLLTYLYEKNVSVKFPITKPEIVKNIMILWKNEDDGESTDNDEETTGTDLASNGIPSPNNDDLQTERNVHEGSETLRSNNEIDRVASNSTVHNNITALAEQFSQWFYELLNENHLSSEHFFPDVSLNLSTVSNGEENSNSVEKNPEDVTNCLLNTKMQYDLFFNPNLSKEGVRGQMDPHGLVMVIVCGTLHSKSVCVGVFEQMFALARDPFAENNWKIKRTDLRLRSSSNVITPPTLSIYEDTSTDIVIKE